ncbi:glutathione ABC transporter substrate-binding protein [Pseudodesulfovibrio sp. zrk46]|uniref:glutathione ABC transporter substrate-binding protein n=1 Tax=Pseudodesulfovibrio sp. zrk46 TaxID=2725288 RepID=UPI0014490937|nr:glutathione ABC transporter substrate-binding protein [Pseudodesulfovibrio sp. zrk46]QJB56746.1 glutathione ABC transporter substrate-binding protein [Pseudodesulfovibrio sp. zrk46]
MKFTRLLPLMLMALLIASPAMAAGKDVVYACDSTVKSLDPHNTSDTYSGAIERTMLQGLMGFDTELKIIPVLAESYTFNDAATEFVFKLRKGIKFHDGADFNAQAVKANIDRMMTGKYKRSSLMKPVKECVVVDDYTIKFTLKEPFGAFVNAIAHPGSLIVSPKAIEQYGDDISKHPVGTGPYEFVKWVSGNYVKIKRNDNYWGEKVKVDTVTFRPVPEGGARLAMLRAGQAHYIYPMPAELAKVAERDNKIEIIRQPSIIARYLIMNTKFEPLSDVRVRQAINYALNKEAIIKIAWGGAGTVLDSIIPPNLQFYSKQGAWPYDVEKAKALMKEAGYEKGFKVTFMTPNASNRLRATEMIKQQLEKINITGDLVSMDVASFYNKLESNKADTVGKDPFLAFGGWSASTGDADWGTRPLLSTEAAPPAMSNFGFFSDKATDDMIQAGLSSADPKVRGDAYAKLQDEIWEKAPWGYLFVDTLTAAKNKKLSGVVPMADGGFNMEKADLQ